MNNDDFGYIFKRLFGFIFMQINVAINFTNHLLWQFPDVHVYTHRVSKLAAPLQISYCKIVNICQIFYKIRNSH